MTPATLLRGKTRSALTALMAMVSLQQTPSAWASDSVISAIYTGEWLQNLDGGIKEDGRFLARADIDADIDLDAVFGLEGASLYLDIMYTNGGAISGEVVGDAQLVSNIEADNKFRLFELYYRQTLMQERLDLLIGLWDLNDDFAVVEPAEIFLNSSHGIGFDFAQSGVAGPSIFPLTSFAGRFFFHVSDELTFKAAVVDAVPGKRGEPDKGGLHLSSREGALLVAEMDYKPASGPRFNGGIWGYTEDFDRLDGNGEEAAYGMYGSIDLSLTKAGSRFGRVDAFLRLGYASDDVHQASGYVGTGLVSRGIFPGRAEDTLGIALASAITSDTARDLGADKHETSLELTYDLRLTDWLRLQPNMQYVLNPGFEPVLDDALVVGIRFELLQAFLF